jgi:hypothetical protein
MEILILGTPEKGPFSRIFPFFWGICLAESWFFGPIFISLAENWQNDFRF